MATKASPTSVRFSLDVDKKIRETAAADRRSFSLMVEILAEEALAARDSK